MLREFMGLPAHALLVHSAVVFVPLLALVGSAYALLPRFRSRLDWAAALLAVLAPLSALLSKLSGSQLQRVLVERNYPETILAQVATHERYGDLTFWWSLALAVLTGVLLLVTGSRWRDRRRPNWLSWALGTGVIVLSVINIIYVYLTGDSGAQAVWQGVL
jgi:uncharacterized membrane protein